MFESFWIEEYRISSFLTCCFKILLKSLQKSMCYFQLEKKLFTTIFEANCEGNKMTLDEQVNKDKPFSKEKGVWKTTP